MASRPPLSAPAGLPGVQQDMGRAKTNARVGDSVVVIPRKTRNTPTFEHIKHSRPAQAGKRQQAPAARASQPSQGGKPSSGPRPPAISAPRTETRISPAVRLLQRGFTFSNNCTLVNYRNIP